MAIVNITGNNNKSDSSNSSTPLSGRGLTKHEAISVEDYDRDRHLHVRSSSSHQTTVRSESPSIYIDLDQYNDEDDDLRILSFTPITKSFEKGQSSSWSLSSRHSFECAICIERKPKIECFRINGCSHFYCNDCVSKYIAAKLQDNILSIKCPVAACTGQLEPYQCRQILPAEVFDRWGDALCEAVVMRSNRYYCPYKDCSALLFLEESEKKINESECPHCNRMVCVQCGTKWHSEITCEEFQSMAEDEREREDILLKKMAESNNWRRCPACKFYIERSEGCFFMKCRCGLAFCYDCGTPSRGLSEYCHNCKQWS